MYRFSGKYQAIVLSATSIAVLTFYSITAPEPQIISFDTKYSMLVLSPHQDDTAIMSAGMVVPNQSLGGDTIVAYITRPVNDSVASMRKAEARIAWVTVGVNNIALVFLGSENIDSPAEKRRILKRLSEIIRPRGTNMLVLPLVEYGNSAHDITGELGKALIDEHQIENALYATTYNPIYKIENNQKKYIALNLRLLPWFPFDPKLHGVNVSAQSKLKMFQPQRDLKRTMLEAFTSQSRTIPIAQFDYPDIFELPHPISVYKIGSKLFQRLRSSPQC